MNQFKDISDRYFHQVSVGPYEWRADKLVYSDIVLHLPVLEYYASLCKHVTEFGVRDAYSTVAFLSGKPDKLLSFDIAETHTIRLLKQIELPTKWEFILADTSQELPFDTTNLIFFDTLHTYQHLKKELAIHARKSDRFLIFHDTFTCGDIDVSGKGEKGIMPAINEFIEQYPNEYKVIYRTNWSNGLIVLERV